MEQRPGGTTHHFAGAIRGEGANKSETHCGDCMNFPRNIWNWLRRQVVDDVPQGEALCEFDCRKPQCTEGEWEVCERRLRRAAGELMPDKPEASPTAAQSAQSKTPAAAPLPEP
jgi:hypothetical protein